MVTPEEFALCLRNGCGVEPGAHVLAAVSGGADSVAMLCLLDAVRNTYPLRLSCAHVEHGIRGEESRADMDFVRALCREKGIDFYGASVDAPAYAAKHGCGLEEAARTLRYDFLLKTMRRIGAQEIAAAHHAGDQAETVLLHAARGCDVGGLAAMSHRSGRLIRPLIDKQSESIRAYLVSIGQSWREDQTNGDIAYARNRIRRNVLPELERAAPGAGRALVRLSTAARRDEDYFRKQIDALRLRMLALVDGEAVRREAIEGLHPALLSRIIVEVIAHAGVGGQSARTIQRIMDALCLKKRTTINLEGGAYARLGRTYLSVNFVRTPETDVPLNEYKTYTPFGSVRIRRAQPGETGDGVTCQAIPSRLLEGARITGRREGDTMVPFGTSACVKVKKLLIDAGIDQGIKASIPVLRTRDGRILWLVGLRPDECCRGEENEEKMIVEMRARWMER